MESACKNNNNDNNERCNESMNYLSDREDRMWVDSTVELIEMVNK